MPRPRRDHQMRRPRRDSVPLRRAGGM